MATPQDSLQSLSTATTFNIETNVRALLLIHTLFTLTVLLMPSLCAQCEYEDVTNTSYICVCDTYQGCGWETIVCIENTKCTVKCLNGAACYLTTIQWPTEPGLGTLECDGYRQACRSVNFPEPAPYNNFSFDCNQENECGFANIYCPKYGNCHITCSAKLACASATIHWSENDVESILECSYGDDECDGVNYPPTGAPTAAPTNVPTTATVNPTASPSDTPTILPSISTSFTSVNPIVYQSTFSEDETQVQNFTITVVFNDCSNEAYDETQNCDIASDIIDDILSVVLDDNAEILRKDVINNKITLTVTQSVVLDKDVIANDIKNELQDKYGDIEVVIEDETSDNKHEDENIDKSKFEVKYLLIIIAVVLISVVIIIINFVKRNNQNRSKVLSGAQMKAKQRGANSGNDDDRNNLELEGHKNPEVIKATNGETNTAHERNRSGSMDVDDINFMRNNSYQSNDREGVNRMNIDNSIKANNAVSVSSSLVAVTEEGNPQINVETIHEMEHYLTDTNEGNISKCNDCLQIKQGKVFETSGKFYCFECWSYYE